MIDIFDIRSISRNSRIPCSSLQWKREINFPLVQSAETISATVFRARVQKSLFAARWTFDRPATRSVEFSALSPAVLWADTSSPFRDSPYRARNPFSRESLEPLRAERSDLSSPYHQLPHITKICFKFEKFCRMYDCREQWQFRERKESPDKKKSLRFRISPRTRDNLQSFRKSAFSGTAGSRLALWRILGPWGVSGMSFP